MEMVEVSALPSDCRQEALRLLRSMSVGRVAVNGPTCPEVFTVDYAVDGGAVVFRLDDEVLDSLGSTRLVTFEADGYDYEADEAWTVTAAGAVEPIRHLGILDPPLGFFASTPTGDEDGARSWVRLVPQALRAGTSTRSTIELL